MPEASGETSPRTLGKKNHFMLRALLDKLDISGIRQQERFFAGRTPLSSQEFYVKYFSGRGFSQDLVVRIKDIFDARIGFDLSRLSSEDDFTTELKFIWDYDSLADVETLVALEEAFDIKISDEEAARMKTIKDVVQLISAKIQNEK